MYNFFVFLQNKELLLTNILSDENTTIFLKTSLQKHVRPQRNDNNVKLKWSTGKYSLQTYILSVIGWILMRGKIKQHPIPLFRILFYLKTRTPKTMFL